MDVGAIGQGGQNKYNTISDNFLMENNNLIFKDNSCDKEEYEVEIKKAVEKLNKFLQGENTHIEYEKHKIFKNQFVIKIINNKTKEIIKEIPPKKILDMVAELCKLAGVIVDKKA